MSEPDVQTLQNTINDLTEKVSYLENESKTAYTKRDDAKKELKELQESIEESKRKAEEEKGEFKRLYDELKPQHESVNAELQETKSALDEANQSLEAINKTRREELTKDMSDDEKKLAETMTIEQLVELNKLKPVEKPRVDTSRATKRVANDDRPKTLAEWRKRQQE